MLVIGRAIGEAIAIDGDIRIRVLGVDGTTVRFGIEAPREVKVHRAEVYRRIAAALGKEGG